MLPLENMKETSSHVRKKKWTPHYSVMTHDHLSSSASSSMVTGNNSSQKSPSPATSPTNGRHPVFRGIRCRSGKWVSEIREPRKTTRIWLGTYPLPEMAAIAYDTAALALKGTEAALNFPESAHLLPVPVSNSPLDIRAAASSAADSISRRVYGNDESKTIETQEDKFVDEEALFDTPQFLMSLAEGLLVSPPRIESPLHYDSPEISQGENLWSYNDRD